LSVLSEALQVLEKVRYSIHGIHGGGAVAAYASPNPSSTNSNPLNGGLGTPEIFEILHWCT